MRLRDVVDGWAAAVGVADPCALREADHPHRNRAEAPRTLLADSTQNRCRCDASSAALGCSRDKNFRGGGFVLPDRTPIWNVALESARADELRREVGSDARAASVEENWESPIPSDAKLLRVEAEEDVAVFVERPHPIPDHGYRRAEIRRLLRETEPTPPSPDPRPGEPLSLGEVLWWLKTHPICREQRLYERFTDETEES